jgi:dipeptidyl aminopeptidase/acylaminoacyl peptidase
MRPTDIEFLPVPGRPTVSADGRRVVVAVSRPDLASDDYVDELWLADAESDGVARPLTTGPSDGAPALSPDGRWLAFLRPGPGGRAQIHLMPATGGPVRVVTDHPLGAGDPVWSPDSRRLGYTARVAAPGRYTGSPDSEAPRRITRLSYFLDGFGYTFDRPRHVHVLDPFILGAAPTRLTDGDHDHGYLTWSPDGTRLAFVSARHTSAGDDARNDIWTCAADGSALAPVTHGGMYVFTPRFSPDGTAVCFSGSLLDARNHSHALDTYGLWMAPADGSGPPRRLTDDRFHLSFASQLIQPAADGVYFASDHRGEVNLVLVPYDGGEPRLALGGARQINGYAVASRHDGDTVAAVVSSATSAGELMTLRAGVAHSWTSFGEQLCARTRLRPMEPFTALAPDGYELHGWVVRPDGPGPHPVILQIKGGPFTQFGYTLTGPAAFDEAQVYAGAGYAVVLGNPRGCSGYGQAHASHVAPDLPRRSAVDLLALLDAALEAPDLDAERVGVMGGSFGGYMTAWLAAHDGKRFRAAIGERGLYAIDSYTATSDDGVEIAIALYGADRERWTDLSPLTHVDAIDIPMLIIQSEQDRHCPPEQAQRLFVELRLRGVPAELLLFPGEGHDMSRSGRPSHRIARFEAVLEWWGRHLGTRAELSGRDKAGSR